jgi:hypothetical protein
LVISANRSAHCLGVMDPMFVKASRFRAVEKTMMAKTPAPPMTAM